MSAFVGYIFDENDAPVQCYHQAFHYNTGKWSDIRQTGVDGYYSRDHEDTDWDGNGVPLPTGDIVLLVFWSNGVDKSGLKDRMSIHKITSTSASVYSTDVQVIPKTEPTCSWNLSTEGTINHNISSSLSSSDVYQWTWNGKIFLHDDNYYGVNIFDSVGSLIHTYDWNTGNGYVSTNNNTYLTIGDYTVNHKSVNQYGLESICAKPLRIKYNAPSAYFTFDSINYNLYDSAGVTFNGTDVDTRITNIDHYFDGSLIQNNTNLNYSYIEDLLEVKVFNIFTEITWNDGFNNLTFNVNDSITLSNIAPTVNLSINNIVNTYNFISAANDLEDDLDIVRFKIYLCSTSIFEETPTACDWSLLDETDILIADWNSSATFYKGGKFKVTVQAKDGAGAWSPIEEIEFDVVVSGTSDGGQNNHFFDWE